MNEMKYLDAVVLYTAEKAAGLEEQQREEEEEEASDILKSVGTLGLISKGRKCGGM